MSSQPRRVGCRRNDGALYGGYHAPRNRCHSCEATANMDQGPIYKDWLPAAR